VILKTMYNLNFNIKLFTFYQGSFFWPELWYFSCLQKTWRIEWRIRFVYILMISVLIEMSKHAHSIENSQTH